MIKKVFMWIGVFLYLSCMTSKVKFGPDRVDPSGVIPERNRTPVVLVPGYLGSELYRKEKDSEKKIYLGLSEALGLSNPDLSLHEEDSILPGKALREVSLPGGFFGVKVYSPIIERLQMEKNLDLHEFPYDWRKPNLHSGEDLILYLEKISKNYDSKIVLIGHSNGGLLSLYATNKRPDLISQLFLAGAPMRGGIGFLEDLMLGNSLGLNKTILEPCTVQTFGSVYAFFPVKEFDDTKNVLQTKDGKEIADDFFSVDFWKKYNLGSYGTKLSCSPKSFPLESYLKLSRKFKESIQFNSSISYPPIRNITSDKHPTARVLKGSETKDGWVWDISNSTPSPGDGRVTIESATLPGGYLSENIPTNYTHSEILNDPSVQSEILKRINSNL
ncbi:MAG: lecithin--cholesterol acyltransferase [Leptospiraceae bacterium]|nr:lecithin--cholesterol acyltransferase [Leptospiraceae bacterium]